jgi:TetR/AcrR family transcriptional repressor of nem operon
MRLTKEQATENRRQIVEVASRLFREKGFDGVAVADLMKAAGFTHGGFYNHFPSKEALAAEASAVGIARSKGTLTERLAQPSPAERAKGWRRYADNYLSTRHRDNPATGCTFAALAGDAAREGRDVQATFAEGLESMIDSLVAHLAEAAASREDPKGRRRALRQWSEMVGAVVLSRAVARADPSLSQEILEASRSAVDEVRLS